MLGWKDSVAVHFGSAVAASAAETFLGVLDYRAFVHLCSYIYILRFAVFIFTSPAFRHALADFTKRDIGRSGVAGR